MVTIDEVITVFWSEGGILKERSTTETEPPRVLDRDGITSESTSAGAAHCELRPMANATKTCRSNKLCQLVQDIDKGV